MNKSYSFFILRSLFVFALINLSIISLSVSRNNNSLKRAIFRGFFDLNNPPKKITSLASLEIGSGQPEIQSFRPAGTTEMVNPFTGDFSYNIPLMDVGGYPINIFYNSGVSMEDEASWVGLGWNLSPGAINRNVRGLPDDFKGENITKQLSVLDNTTIGTSGGINSEIFGLPISVGLNAGYNFNSYNGLGVDLGLSVSGSFSMDNVPLGMGGGLNLQLSSGNGITLGAGANLNVQLQNFSNGNNTGGFRSHNISAGFSNNSRAGFTAQLNHSFTTGLAYKINGKAFQGASVGINYPLSFAKEVFTPAIDVPMNSLSLAGRVQAGAEIQGVTVSADAKIYFSWQGLGTKQFTNPAYGYLYSELAETEKKAILDFNREHENSFEVENPQLPTTNFSYDVYSVSGQGISGMFRPYRNDAGIVANNEVTTLSGSGELGGDIATGTLAKVGAELGLDASSGYSGRWQGENEVRNRFKFSSTQGEAETYYFKDVGEKNIMANENAFDALNGFNPVPLILEKQGLLPAKLKTSVPSGITKTKREFRNTHFSVMNFEEKKIAGLDRRIQLFNANEAFDLEHQSRTGIDWTADLYKPYHIGEINVTRDDGTRYYYGLPVYNILKKEVSFNISQAVPASSADSTNFAAYTPDTDNSVNNEKGTNHYFSAVVTPPYAYAYLLTAILSTDYIDLTGDGPSSDDLGSYTRFNYIKGNEKSKWRNPVQKDSAFYEKAVVADPEDDMANYTYGEKQIYYVHSIETRNYVAEFKVSPRKDMHGVTNENGGIDTDDQSMKLDSIILYAKSDRVKNGTRAVPVKTVRFVYSYNLCKKHPSSETGLGKLTLERIVISYKKSKKEIHSPYVFGYASNPDYAYRNSDRWGMFKKSEPKFPLQKKFAFTPQLDRQNNADISASAWSLTKIDLPTGGTIKITYEADDYGYVQDRRAMQMFKIAGMAASNTGQPTNSVYTNESNINSYVFFDLLEPVPALNGERILKEYLTGIKELFFQINTKVRYSGQHRLENIKGFAQLKNEMVFGSDYGFVSASNDGKHYRAWLKLGNADGLQPNFSFHPFAMATFDFVRRNYRASGEVPLDKDSPIDQVITAFAGLAAGISEAIAGGFNNRMINDRTGDTIKLEESFIRLNNPFKRKIGGGSRVKRIEIHDNWKKMTQGLDSNFYYGSEYEYTDVEDFYGEKRIISSGVASYEPMIGAEENPFVQPHRYSIRFPIFGVQTFPIENKMHMLPYGESFYPAPSVGYNKVKIRNLARPGVKSTATGFIIKEFYTAKDFPTIYRELAIPPARVKIPPIPFPLLQVDIDFLTAAQSHVIELNDMHGKPKADWVYKESDILNPISGIEYKYKRVSENGPLDNIVKVVDKAGNVNEALVGVEYDVIADERENSVGSLGLNIQGNIDVIQTLVPTPIPMIWPALSGSKKIFRSFSATKVIMRSGILESVIAHDLGALVTTKNELFDEVTGQVIMTSANNEFGDTIYTIGIPAHWHYDGMGPAFINSGYEIKNKTVSNGRLTLTPVENKFIKGDEVLVLGNDNLIAWVLATDPTGIDLITEVGNPVNIAGPVSLKVLRSGRRNMQNLVIGKIITKKNPILTGYFAANSQILHAETNEYTDKWNTYAGFNIELSQYECHCEKASGCRFSAVTMLIQKAIDSLLLAGSFQINAVNNAEMYKSLSDCWGKEKVNHNTIIGSSIENGRMAINLTEDSRAVCRFEFPDPFIMVSKRGTNLNIIPVRSIAGQATSGSRKGIRIKVESVEYVDNCNGTEVLFRLKLVYRDSTGIINTRYLDGITRCISRSCWEDLVEPKISCNIISGDTVNPYRLGLLGVFRPLRTLLYLSERNSGPIRDSGTYKHFTTFNYANAGQNTNWQFVQENKSIDPFGKVLEARDPLDRYDADLYGYDHNLVIASAKNARYRQIAFDGFEDYGYQNHLANTGECEMPEHLSFQPYKTTNWDSSTSHTGFGSLKLRRNQPVSIKRKLTSLAETTQSNDNILNARQLLGVFNPDTGTYVFSAWVFHEEINKRDTAFSVTIKLAHSNLPDVILTPSGKRVDGWQQVNGIFRVNTLADSIEIVLRNESTRLFYLDDLRIFPFNATMSSYVYDPVTLQLMAELDDNNFATLYEYDEEGNLARIKKETEKGILTVQEVRAGKPKQ
jgi:hypothetical protein